MPLISLPIREKYSALIKTSNLEDIKFNYDDDSKTLKIFLSDNLESYISLPSMNPSEYTINGDLFDKSYEMKSINSGILIMGIEFIKDFLDSKEPKFSNLFIFPVG